MSAPIEARAGRVHWRGVALHPGQARELARIWLAAGLDALDDGDALTAVRAAELALDALQAEIAAGFTGMDGVPGLAPYVHHIDGDPLNNDWANLRLVDKLRNDR